MTGAGIMASRSLRTQVATSASAALMLAQMAVVSSSSHEQEVPAPAPAKAVAGRAIDDVPTAGQAVVSERVHREVQGEAELEAGVAKNPREARQRLYLETVADLLPTLTNKVVVAPGRDVGLYAIGGR
jgi:hypothetical protein